MILVDTSVWINHLQKTDAHLVASLDAGLVTCHPYIIGELAGGNLKNRGEILQLLQSLPSSPLVEPDEILTFIESNSLMGEGLGYIDVHLLASSVLGRAPLWTDHKRLRKISNVLGVCHRR